MGRTPCCQKVGLKRGRWTAEEDEILRKYIQANGEGGWRSLPKNAGLLRCGKSCRLRWINYLRSDVKRGNITVEEEDIIVKLHASLGNRWSLIAGYLPGRTDNEIKNYWNSHLSRRLVLHSYRRPKSHFINNINIISSTSPAAKPKYNLHRRRPESESSSTEDAGGGNGSVAANNNANSAPFGIMPATPDLEKEAIFSSRSTRSRKTAAGRSDDRAREEITTTAATSSALTGGQDEDRDQKNGGGGGIASELTYNYPQTSADHHDHNSNDDDTAGNRDCCSSPWAASSNLHTAATTIDDDYYWDLPQLIGSPWNSSVWELTWEDIDGNCYNEEGGWDWEMQEHNLITLQPPPCKWLWDIVLPDN